MNYNLSAIPDVCREITHEPDRKKQCLSTIQFTIQSLDKLPSILIKNLFAFLDLCAADAFSLACKSIRELSPGAYTSQRIDHAFHKIFPEMPDRSLPINHPFPISASVPDRLYAAAGLIKAFREIQMHPSFNPWELAIYIRYGLITQKISNPFSDLDLIASRIVENSTRAEENFLEKILLKKEGLEQKLSEFKFSARELSEPELLEKKSLEKELEKVKCVGSRNTKFQLSKVNLWIKMGMITRVFFRSFTPSEIDELKWIFNEIRQDEGDITECLPMYLEHFTTMKRTDVHPRLLGNCWRHLIICGIYLMAKNHFYTQINQDVNSPELLKSTSRLKKFVEFVEPNFVSSQLRGLINIHLLNRIFIHNQGSDEKTKVDLDRSMKELVCSRTLKNNIYKIVEMSMGLRQILNPSEDKFFNSIELGSIAQDLLEKPPINADCLCKDSHEWAQYVLSVLRIKEGKKFIEDDYKILELYHREDSQPDLPFFMKEFGLYAHLFLAAEAREYSRPSDGSQLRHLIDNAKTPGLSEAAELLFVKYALEGRVFKKYVKKNKINAFLIPLIQKQNYEAEISYLRFNLDGKNAKTLEKNYNRLKILASDPNCSKSDRFSIYLVLAQSRLIKKLEHVTTEEAIQYCRDIVSDWNASASLKDKAFELLSESIP